MLRANNQNHGAEARSANCWAPLSPNAGFGTRSVSEWMRPLSSQDAVLRDRHDWQRVLRLLSQLYSRAWSPKTLALPAGVMCPSEGLDALLHFPWCVGSNLASDPSS